MNPPRRYFDHAATSFPKAPGVVEAVTHQIAEVAGSAGRGAYREAVEGGKLLTRTRNLARRLVSARDSDAVIFTLNGTDALNIAIKSLVPDGAHVITTGLDHNSVLRPLAALAAQRRVNWQALPPSESSMTVEPHDLESALRPDTKLVVVNHASNVTGAIQPVEIIAAICRERRVPFLLDAAQTAGHLPIDMARIGADLIATPGHKGLLGPLGTGLLIFRSELAARMQTVREGGTGSASEHPAQPDVLPDKFEAGSHNAVGIAGLHAALEWILQRGVESLREHELSLIRRMTDRLNAIRGLAWFGPRDPMRRVGVFSLRIEGVDPAELGMLLEQQFGILARPGLHCAPLAHRALGTDTLGGTTRLSIGAFHTLEDIDAAADALAAVAAQCS